MSVYANNINIFSGFELFSCQSPSFQPDILAVSDVRFEKRVFFCPGDRTAETVRQRRTGTPSFPPEKYRTTVFVSRFPEVGKVPQASAGIDYWRRFLLTK